MRSRNDLHDEEKETGRIEAFSDGVFAIAITLLVLTIKIPEPAETAQTGLLAALGRQWPVYLALVASFFFILVMWINHHRLYTVIRRSDNNLLLLNGLLLFGVTVVPFTTALVAQYLPTQEKVLAVIVYSGWFFIISVFFNLLWRYASYKNRLFNSRTDSHLVAFISRQYWFGPIFYLAALLVAFVNPYLSLFLSIALAVFFALPNKSMQQLMDE